MPFTLTLGDDGILLMKDSTNSNIWSSEKQKSDTLFSKPTGSQYSQLLPGESLYSKNGLFNLILQRDGNLVVYKENKPIWASNTVRAEIARAVIQEDANFVIYDKNNRPFWASGTNRNGSGQFRIILGDDGYLTLIDNNNQLLWTTKKPQSDSLKSDANSNEYNLLKVGESIYSKNNRFRFTLQEDGNLVYFDGNVPKWTSNTNGKSGSYVIMQSDGNLVLYTSANSPIWASGTNGYIGGPYRLVVGDEGTLIVYGQNNYPLWTAFRFKDTLFSYQKGVDGGDRLKRNESIKSLNDRFILVMQDDGNLVIYDNGRPIWATNTNGKGGSYAVIQDDRNFVVYTDGNRPIWASNSNGRGLPPCKLIMQNDGNLVLYGFHGQAQWASNTQRR